MCRVRAARVRPASGSNWMGEVRVRSLRRPIQHLLTRDDDSQVVTVAYELQKVRSGLETLIRTERRWLSRESRSMLW